MSNTRAYEIGVEHAKKAVTSDNDRKYEDAVEEYTHAIQHFTNVLRWETNEALAEVIKEKTEGYVRRAEELKRHLQDEMELAAAFECDLELPLPLPPQPASLPSGPPPPYDDRRPEQSANGLSLVDIAEALRKELGLSGNIRDVVNEAASLLGISEAGSLIETSRKCHIAVFGETA